MGGGRLLACGFLFVVAFGFGDGDPGIVVHGLDSGFLDSRGWN